jgi:EAL domain-containing protein (putative c-di-GMP-specific phosphodiesterase class I)/ABC-type branched-subunit amino acid transport system substrate-binding protein/CheY-like chemotaxis protein
MPLKILIIDVDTDITDHLQEVAVRLGHHVTIESDSRQVEPLLTTVFDLIFLELCLPFLDGIQVMRILSEKKVSAALVLMSGCDKAVLNTAHELAEAHELNTMSPLSKPFKEKAIEALISEVEQAKSQWVNKPVAQRQMSSDDIRKAFDEDRVEVHYQPQLDVKMNRVVGLEALCRIRDNQNNLIYPDQFIDEVERLGLIHELTLAVAIIAAQDYADLSAQYNGLTISINISTRDLDDLFFPDVLETIFAEHKINPNFVIIEVTEDILLQNLSVSLDVLARIRLKGFKISIDDFGKGSTSLDNLKYFPATELKIHREFIQSIGEKDKSHVLVKHTMELAHHLGLDVVAQGVENQDVLDWLIGQGCDLIQGYWYSKPLSKSGLLDFLKAARVGLDIDTTFSSQDNDVSLEGLQVTSPLIQDLSNNDDDTLHNQIIISSILPLTGGFNFIGHSKLYGINAALKEYHDNKIASGVSIKLEVFDDQSDINHYMELAKKKISPRSIACLGGVFTLGNMKWFVQSALAMKIAVIGPFSGSNLLRDAKWSNFFNVRPSYEDELASIAEHLIQKRGKILFVYPGNAFGKRSAVVFDKLIRSEHLSYGSEHRSQKFLIESINQSNAMHVVFVGGTKSFADIINDVSLKPVNFYSISLIGLGSLKRYVKNCQNVFVTAPIDDYQDKSSAATQYRKHIKPFLTESTSKYRNSISFESYLNTLVLLRGLDKCPTHRKLDLIKALESLSSVDIGLSTPVTWDPENRQFLHNVTLLGSAHFR